MSMRGDATKKQITALSERVALLSGKNAVFMRDLLSILEDINTRVLEMERDNGPSDAFVDPNEGSHPIR